MGKAKEVLGYIVQDYNETVRAQELAQIRLDDDKKLCRAYLGMDSDPFHGRPLMMACAREVADKLPPPGTGERIKLYQRAWDRCMPNLAVCDRALR